MENKVRTFLECRNPVLPPDICIPDGEAHEFAGRLYVYGSCDQDDVAYCSQEYYVVSTEDMQTWTLHEKALDGRRIPWLGEGCKLYPSVDMDVATATPILRKQLKEWGIITDERTTTDSPQNINPAENIKQVWD